MTHFRLSNAEFDQARQLLGDPDTALRLVDVRAARRVIVLSKAIAISNISDEAVYAASNSIYELMIDASNVSRSIMNRVTDTKPKNWSLNSKETKSILKTASATEKEAMRKLFGSLAKAGVNTTMSSVRDKLLTAVAQEAKGRHRNQARTVKQAIRGAAKSHLATAARTQTSFSFNATTWAQALEDDDLWGFQYSDAGDSRVRPEHKRMDGVRYPKTHKFWVKYAPPNGWNCRCGIIPIYKGERLARMKSLRGTPDVDPAFLINPGLLLRQVR